MENQVCYTDTNSLGQLQSSNNLGQYQTQSNYPPYTYYYQSYPIYIYHDKTKKAMDILQKLQEEKLLEIKSVTKFVETVNKIAGLL